MKTLIVLVAVVIGLVTTVEPALANCTTIQTFDQGRYKMCQYCCYGNGTQCTLQCF